jgi:hypothetical protein
LIKQEIWTRVNFSYTSASSTLVESSPFGWSSPGKQNKYKKSKLICLNILGFELKQSTEERTWRTWRKSLPPKSISMPRMQVGVGITVFNSCLPLEVNMLKAISNEKTPKHIRV